MVSCCPSIGLLQRPQRSCVGVPQGPLRLSQGHPSIPQAGRARPPSRPSQHRDQLPSWSASSGPRSFWRADSDRAGALAVSCEAVCGAVRSAVKLRQCRNPLDWAAATGLPKSRRPARSRNSDTTDSAFSFRPSIRCESHQNRLPISWRNREILPWHVQELK